MKVNLPVTGQEKPYPRGQTIVSKTDLKGAITYANDAFVELSGFTQEELIGKNHNIVRHPDMPVEAYADLWRTIKKNRPWRGVVKNRCKNGDHYWVEAMVVPIRENNQTVGYMSVRKEAARAKVESAERLYKQIREKVVPFPRASRSLQNASIKTRFGVYTGVMLLLLTVTGLLGMYGMSEQNVALQNAQKSGLEPAIALARIQILMGENRTQVALAVQHAPDNPSARLHTHALALHTDLIPKNAEEINKLWSEIEKVSLNDETKELAEAFIKHRAEYVKQGVFPAHKALLEADYGRANSLLNNQINPLYELANLSGKKLFDKFNSNATQDYQLNSQQYFSRRLLMVVAILSGLLTGLIATYMLSISITRPLKKAIEYFDHLAQGRFDGDIQVDRGDEVGAVMASIAATQIQLRVIIDEIRLASNALSRRCAELEEEMQGIATHSQSQQEGVYQVGSAIEQVSVSVKEVAVSAEHASKAARHSLHTVNDGREQMSRCLASTAGVVTAVQNSSNTLHHLSESINKIGAISQAISGIAKQTNLLALNAAIESARAGEQGRGFAVVADEVRKLAERTASSTVDIAKMIEEINATTHEAVVSMDSTVKEVQGGRELLESTNEKFNEVNSNSEQVTDMAGRIADAVEEQSSASQNVAGNMERMTALIDKNANSIQNFRRSIRELSVTADDLHKLVAHFDIST